MNYMEKILQKTDTTRSLKRNAINKKTEKQYCGGFIKGKDNFCINFTGNKNTIESCGGRCSIHMY